MSELEEQEQQIGSAIADVLQPEMVTRWVLAVETLTEDGQRALAGFTSDGLTPWDSLGMLDFMRAREVAAIGDQQQ